MRYWVMLPIGGLLFGLAMMVLAGNEVSTPSWLPNLAQAKQPAHESTQCVESVDVMRRMHGSFLNHHRDRTMYLGVRTKQYSLIGCIDCHVSPNEAGEYPSIKSKEHFCVTCHQYTAVKIDCFSCHASKPGM